MITPINASFVPRHSYPVAQHLTTNKSAKNLSSSANVTPSLREQCQKISASKAKMYRRIGILGLSASAFGGGSIISIALGILKYIM